jgi:cytochrome d ubiquinol oxidase subunit II
MIANLAASMGMAIGDPAFWMPLVIMGILFALTLGGVLFDGFDVGVGLLLRAAPPDERSHMMVILSPWRDANEMWLLLALGLFLAAFPLGWAAVLAHLYLPLGVVMLGVMLRSVAFEFRLRAAGDARVAWINRFWFGSLLTAAGHGLLLSAVVTGYQQDSASIWFSVFVAVCTVAAYALLGSCWIVMRLTGTLQVLAATWARHAIRWTAAGMVALAVALGLANPAIFYKWSNATRLMLAVPLWFVMLLCFVGIDVSLLRATRPKYQHLAWLPFCLCVLLFALLLGGLAYSMFPFIILDNLTIWDAAAALGSLQIVLIITVIGAPVMFLFNLMGYRTLFGRVP